MKFIKKIWAKWTISDEVKREKQLATLNDVPWVKVIDVIMKDPSKPTAGYFELDWNQLFVDSLIKSGYSGRTESELVDAWFNDLCRGVIGDNV